MKGEELRGLLEGERFAARGELQSLLATRDDLDRQIKETREYLERVDALLSSWDQSKVEALPMFRDKVQVDEPLKDLTIADGSYAILKEVDIPLHTKQILAALQTGGKVISSKTPRISISSALLRDDRFENIGGNTWRIKESIRDEDGDGMS